MMKIHLRKTRNVIVKRVRGKLELRQQMVHFLKQAVRQVLVTRKAFGVRSFLFEMFSLSHGKKKNTNKTTPLQGRKAKRKWEKI